MRDQWHIPSVQATGQAVNTIVTHDEENGRVLLGTADRGLTHLDPRDARSLAEALTEAADRADPRGDRDVSRKLLDALQAYIAEEFDR